MFDSNLPLIQAYQPLSFLERGVFVPFTTPALAGARVRTGKNRVAEYIMANPSGGRGVYVVQWSGLQSFCQPTVHDVLLQARMALLPEFSPATVRLAARDIAASGYAGQGARQAVAAAVAHDLAAMEQANQKLLALLIDQLQPALPGRDPAPLTVPELEVRGRQVIRQAASILGCPIDAIGRALTVLARSFTPTGLDDTGQTARLPALLHRMTVLRDELTVWADDGMPQAGRARDVAKIAHITVSCAEALLRETRALSTNTLALLRTMLASPADTLRRLERVDWLLDGWDLPCLMWEAASLASQRQATLVEIAQMVPGLPKEIQAWMGRSLPPVTAQQSSHSPTSSDPSRSGSSVFAAVARNERFRAMSV